MFKNMRQNWRRFEEVVEDATIDAQQKTSMFDRMGDETRRASGSSSALTDFPVTSEVKIQSVSDRYFEMLERGEKPDIDSLLVG